MKRPWTYALLGSAMATMVGVTGVEAAEDTVNAITYRQTVMKGVGAHIGAIAAVIKGEVSHTNHVAAHARSLHALSLMLPDIFPPGSDVGDTRAKPEIWRETAKFKAAIKTLQTASSELAQVAETGDMAATGAALGKVGEACGGCHKPFRKPK